MFWGVTTRNDTLVPRQTSSLGPNLIRVESVCTATYHEVAKSYVVLISELGGCQR
jgi:hypothetical protein